MVGLEQEISSLGVRITQHKRSLPAWSWDKLETLSVSRESNGGINVGSNVGHWQDEIHCLAQSAECVVKRSRINQVALPETAICTRKIFIACGSGSINCFKK
jgi:hypothetical protein